MIDPPDLSRFPFGLAGSGATTTPYPGALSARALSGILGAMKKLMLAALAAIVLSPSSAPAQVAVQIQVGIPANPPMVVVQPGIQVVENWNEEVFFTGGYYWVRRDGYWYRAPSPRATWVYVEPYRVPPGLTRLPPGHYRHYGKEQAKAEQKAWKEHEKAEKKARKEYEKGEGGRGHGRGHGHD